MRVALTTRVVFTASIQNMFFFFNDTATTEIYTLSLHDALPISRKRRPGNAPYDQSTRSVPAAKILIRVVLEIIRAARRSEEHTSELQSQSNLVCRLLLEKKKPPSLRAITSVVPSTPSSSSSSSL